MTHTSPFVDIGANLTHESFRHDLDEVLGRAKQLNVAEIVVTGTSVESSSAALALTDAYPGRLFATAGVHPHDAEEFQGADIDRLRSLLAKSTVLAVGETGLDYNRNYSSKKSQLYAFEAQLELAVETRLPVFVHERDASEDATGLLRRYRDKISHAVVHCFTGEEETLRGYLDLDLHIGITGWICDERRGMHLRELVKLIPDDRLMLETDAPYLMPRDYPDKKQLHSSRRNEPCTLAHIANTVAHCRQQSLESLSAHCRDTSVSFFDLPLS